MAWRPAYSLTALHKQLKIGAPAAAPPATLASSWGLIGDAAHDPTSDHAPKDFPGWGKGIVTAADLPNAPALGLDAFKVLDDIRKSHDPRVKYGISNGKIFSAYRVTQDGVTYDAWTWRPYKGSNKHFDHGHLSVVGDSRADGTQPWATIGAPPAAVFEEEDDMGASFGPIDIKLEGATSLTIPPVEAGAADPRPAWLNVCNETFGDVYGLRIWYTIGNEFWAPLPGTDGGLVALRSAQRLSRQLPKGTVALSVTRKAVDPFGKVIEPDDEHPVYAGHLTLAIERGAVIRPS